MHDRSKRNPSKNNKSGNTINRTLKKLYNRDMKDTNSGTKKAPRVVDTMMSVSPIIHIYTIEDESFGVG